MARYAALDIGTVTCRMLVADVSADGALQEIDRYYNITNLGQGVDASGYLRADAIARVTDTVDDFLARLTAINLQDGVDLAGLTAVATSASRDAQNADEFAQALLQRGIQLSVIPGEKEASLSFAGASAGFAGQRVVVVDVGGGSTEVVAGVAGKEPEFIRSFDVGCRRLTERYFGEVSNNQPIPRTAAENGAAWVAGEMASYFQQLQAAGYGGAKVIAVAGTATSVVSIQKHMEVYDSAAVHGSVVSRESLAALTNELLEIPLDQRQQVIGLDPRRADVMPAGMIILDTVLELLGADAMTVSESDILQGLILDIARTCL